jgi:lactoylglutathione lyase
MLMVLAACASIGWRVARRIPQYSVDRAIARWMDLGRGLELHLVGGRTAPAVTVRQVHLALRTPNLARTLGYLRARGMGWQDNQGNVGRISSVRTDGVRQIFLQDPDGYWLEVNGTLPPGYPE